MTEKSDVYSFGVVLLELVTGRNPIDSEYGDGKDIVYWVASHLNSDSILEVLDHRLPDSCREEMIKVLMVAIFCTTKLPSVRPTMREVVNLLSDADPLNHHTKWKNNNYKQLGVLLKSLSRSSFG